MQNATDSCMRAKARSSADEDVRAVSWARAEGRTCAGKRILLWESVPRARRPISWATTLAIQGVTEEMIPMVIALGLVLERWWCPIFVATALVWPPQPDGS
jgi:hypothetical protein